MSAPAPVLTFTTAANAYSAAVVASSTDPALPDMLAALPGLCDAAIASLRVNTTPEVADAISACEVLLAQCAALGDSILAQSPPLVAFPVPQAMPLSAVAERFYGANAMAHYSEILSLNPSIFGVPLIPAGTVLQLAQATQ